MLKLFITFELSKIKKYFTNKASAKLITTGLFLLVFLALGVGMYHFFASSFRYINAEAQEGIKLALLLFLYELFLLVLASILIFSTIITSLFSLFKGVNASWILSTPAYKYYPRILFIKSLLGSSSILLVMFLPAFLALATVYTLPAYALIVILLSVLLFSLFLNTVTLLALLLVSYVYYKLSKVYSRIKFSFAGLITLVIAIILPAILFIWRTVKNVDLYGVFKGNERDGAVSLQSMASHFTSLPTHPFAMEIISFQNNVISSGFFYFVLMFLSATVLTIFWWYVSILFYPMWQKLQEGTPLQVKQNSSLGTYHFTGSILATLFKKEVLISTRNYKAVLWFFFLLAIWLMQLAANVLLNHNVQKYQDDISPRMISLQVTQYIIAVYFISAFTLRFVFPAFSVEKKTAWILGSAPITFSKVFLSRFAFYASFFTIIGVVMNYINGHILHLSTAHTLYSMILFVIVVVFIVILGLSLGAIFPSTESDDPEVVSTSIPGLFFTALALLYGGISDATLYLMLKNGATLWYFSFIVLSTTLGLTLLIKTPYFVRKNRQ